MDESNKSAGGTKSVNRKLDPLQTRLAGLAVMVVAALLLVAWLKSGTWRQLERLQDDFAARKTETFYLGIQLQGEFERANRVLLREQLSKTGPAAAADLHQRLQTVRARLLKAKPELSTPREIECARALGAALDAYQAEAGAMLDQGLKAIRRDSAALVAAQIEQISGPLMHACQDLIQAQKTAWNEFLRASELTANKLQTISLLSSGLQVLLVLVVAALLHRTLIVPLQARLSASQALIERQEKLASLGTLAAGVAHEIRNPLTAIKFRLFSLKKTLPREFHENDDLQVIGSELNRLERIVKDFLQFARPTDPELGDVPAGQLLEELRNLLAAQLEPRAIQIKVEPAEPVMLRVDRQQILQVLINLAQNAAESIDREGTITLRVRRGAARFNGGHSPAATIEIADTGKGIPAEVQKRLFDPFYSTKDGGTGLGLCIAARIVSKHGGRLQYQTVPSRGTTFQVVLPCANHHASENPPR